MDSDTQKHSILVVEDEEALNKLLVLKLRSKGYKVFSASNGQEGLKTSFDEHPDLIILDLIMPVMDGMEMLRELRKDQWGKDAKVICLTNHNVDETTADLIADYNPMFYLIKADNTLEEIVNKLQECF